MIKAYALIGFDGCVLGQPFATRELAQTTLDNMGPLSFGVELLEIDYNDEPLDAEGLDLEQEFIDYAKETKLIKFHQSVLPAYYAKSRKERIKMFLDTMKSVRARRYEENTTLDSNLTTTNFDEPFEQVDVRDWVNGFDEDFAKESEERMRLIFKATKKDV